MIYTEPKILIHVFRNFTEKVRSRNFNQLLEDGKLNPENFADAKVTHNPHFGTELNYKTFFKNYIDTVRNILINNELF